MREGEAGEGGPGWVVHPFPPPHDGAGEGPLCCLPSPVRGGALPEEGARLGGPSGAVGQPFARGEVPSVGDHAGARLPRTWIFPVDGVFFPFSGALLPLSGSKPVSPSCA